MKILLLYFYILSKILDFLVIRYVENILSDFDERIRISQGWPVQQALICMLDNDCHLPQYLSMDVLNTNNCN